MTQGSPGLESGNWLQDSISNIFESIKERINELAINDPEDNESDKYHFKESIL